MTYFEHTLSKCKSQSISRVCGELLTIDQLKAAASKGFGGCHNITSDSILKTALDCYLHNIVIVYSKRFDSDSRIIYDRCENKVHISNMSHDELFDCLVDFIWLYASIDNGRSRQVHLLSNPAEITGAVRIMLSKRYESAIKNYNKCNHIHEAIQARKKFFSGLYPFQYEESQEYLERNEQGYVYSLDSLAKQESSYQEQSVLDMALFYNLTATAALADYYWRLG